MYWNILKRDIKRKKTMNVILLLFTILAAVFVASGLNNVVTVMNGTDYFLKSRDQRLCVVHAEWGWRRRADPENIGMCKGLQHGKMYLGNEWRCHISGRETEGKEQYFVDTIAGYDAVSLFSGR